MKYIVSVLIILMHIKQVMSIFDSPSELAEGDERNAKEIKESLKDDPNFGQTLLSHRFIDTARRLFNKESPINDYFSGLKQAAQGRYHMKMKNEDTGKNKGFYEVDNEVNAVNSEINVGHSLVEHYDSGNKQTGNYSLRKRRRMMPVECVKTNPKQMICVHGDIIYKLLLPTTDLTEDDLGKLVETVYKEVEAKHMASFSSRLYKRDTDKTVDLNNIISAETLFGKDPPEKVFKFSLPIDESEESDPDEESQNTNSYDNVEEMRPEEIRKIPGNPPSELLYEINAPPAYSSRWFSKRHATTSKIKLRNRVKKNKRNKLLINPKMPLMHQVRADNIGKIKKNKKTRSDIKSTLVNKIEEPTLRTTFTPLPPLGPPVKETKEHSVFTRSYYYAQPQYENVKKYDDKDYNQFNEEEIGKDQLSKKDKNSIITNTQKPLKKVKERRDI